jgi:hypothetical protein
MKQNPGYQHEEGGDYSHSKAISRDPNVQFHLFLRLSHLERKQKTAHGVTGDLACAKRYASQSSELGLKITNYLNI